jgi:hypothetical protein
VPQAIASASTLVRSDEIERLLRIGQQLVVRELSLGAGAVLGFRLAGFERAEHTELAFHRCPDPMRHPRHPFGDGHVVVVVGRRLHVGFQRAVHHHRGEAVA